MARIIEGKRRIINLSADDIFDIVRAYQKISKDACCYEHIREKLEKSQIFIPEDI